MSRPRGADATLFRDVASAVLYLAPMQALLTLISFIAISRLDASVAWVGILGSAGYWGQLWNLALGRVTAKVDLRAGLALLMAAQGLLLAAAALQHSLLPYAALIIPLLVLFGLYEVQYATLVPHLYRPEERPRALGVRNFAVAAGTALLAALFGRFSGGAAGHTPVFLLAGLAMVAAGLVFRGIRPAGPSPEAAGAPRMPVLRLREIAGVWFGPRDGAVLPAHRRAFRRLALVLVLYGWYGAGLSTMLVVVYDRLGFDEWRVGLLAAIATLGTLLSSLLVAPRLRLLGGTTNFRLCFGASLVSVVLLAVAVLFVAGPAGVLVAGRRSARDGHRGDRLRARYPHGRPQHRARRTRGPVRQRHDGRARSARHAGPAADRGRHPCRRRGVGGCSSACCACSAARPWSCCPALNGSGRRGCGIKARATRVLVVIP